MVYAITGVTGKVGGEVAKNLLTAGKTVRAVMRDEGKASPLRARGCGVAIADMADGAALTRAFGGCDAVFVLLPPNFDPSPGFPEVQVVLSAIHEALAEARPSRVVCISTVGAQATTENLLSTLGMMERAFADLTMPVAYLRPAWFMENHSWDMAPAKERGVIPSFLQPLDKALPMIATRDVAQVAAELLQETWNGRRVVELEGPTRVSPRQVAEAFSSVLQKEIRVEAVPRDTWKKLFIEQGMKNPTPRMRMLDGFNEGWIDFEHHAKSIRGTTTLESVLATFA